MSIRKRFPSALNILERSLYRAIFINNFITLFLSLIGHTSTAAQREKTSCLMSQKRVCRGTTDSSAVAVNLIILSRKLETPPCVLLIVSLFRSLSARTTRFYLFFSTMRHARPLWNFRHSAIDSENGLSLRCTSSSSFPLFRLPRSFYPFHSLVSSVPLVLFEIISVLRYSLVSILQPSSRDPLGRLFAPHDADCETNRRFLSVF